MSLIIPPQPDWEELAERIDDMIGDDDCRYDYASDTLIGIREWIEEHETCTERQIEAVDNIEAKPSKGTSWD